MLMTRKNAFIILSLPEDAPEEEVEKKYAELSLLNHPDRKTSSAHTTKTFKDVGVAFKRLQQSFDEDWVEPFSSMEMFSSKFGYRMDVEKGCIYFSYFPFSNMHDIDSDVEDDCDYDDDDDDDDCVCMCCCCHSAFLDGSPLPFEDEGYLSMYHQKFKELAEKADKVAEDLLKEEAEARRKENRKREKKLRRKEKKKRTSKRREGKTNNLAEKTSDLKKCGSCPREPLALLSNNNTNHQSISCEQTTVGGGAPPLTAKHCLKQGDSVGRISKSRNRLDMNSLMENKSERTAAAEKDKENISNSSSSNEADESAMEPVLDESSAFVLSAKSSKIVNERSNVIAMTASRPPMSKSLPEGNDTKNQDARLLSRRLANQGNQLAGNEEYAEACKLYTCAIDLYGSDHRYYGNRSFCYERMGNYEKALEDADAAIQLSSSWAKGHCRRIKALIGLKLYSCAEKSYHDVLELDSSPDSIALLGAIRLAQLTDMGFDKEKSEVILRQSECSSLQDAIERLLLNDQADAKDIDVSDDESCSSARESDTSSPEEDSYCPESLWVGNVISIIVESDLRLYFSRFGKVDTIIFLYRSQCAFVNFLSAQSAADALTAARSIKIRGVKLQLGYAKRSARQPIASCSQARDLECRYWRSTGCLFGSNCFFKHVPAHKGVDLQIVERTPYQCRSMLMM